jgi:hypothetical protein
VIIPSAFSARAYPKQSADARRNKEVNMLEPTHSVRDTGTSYASVIEEMQSMYLLSFLLTADHDKAEQCLVSTIGEGPEGIGVFMDWTRLWARRAVIEHAIDLIVPAPEHADDVSRVSLTEPARWTDKIPFAAILLLDAFERFVFVMSILEGESDEECAILLRCSRRDVMMARVLALQRQSSTDVRGLSKSRIGCANAWRSNA